MKNYNERKDKLIRTLYTSSDDDARNSSVFELAAFDDTKALNALYVCASDPKDLPVIQSACGEAIAEIMTRNESLDMKFVDGLSPIALKAFKAYVKERKKEWLKEI